MSTETIANKRIIPFSNFGKERHAVINNEGHDAHSRERLEKGLSKAIEMKPRRVQREASHQCYLESIVIADKQGDYTDPLMFSIMM